MAGPKKTQPLSEADRPTFPRRAVITCGMPYGNKDLHFGHIGGVFIHADAFARFLRDRIGGENVLLVSGTDCYGSPIVEYHRNAVANGEFEGPLEAFVEFNHKRQREVLSRFNIELDVFAASSLEPYVSVHRDLCAEVLRTLHDHGHLIKRTTPQFYDTEMDSFLNGRQVLGRCPVEGCKSEKGYADECDLGHQYEPKDLLDPRSTLSGKPPEMRDATNWYIDLRGFREQLMPWLESLRRAPGCRQFMVSNMLEYFAEPIIHVTKDQLEALAEVQEDLPAHEQREGRAKSVQLVFDSLESLEGARGVLAQNNIRYRTGKTLMPFRLTGNLDWGLFVPELDGLEGLTFWVWPESLWAPISFTSAHLQGRGEPADAWKQWWCAEDSRAFQFIGEDNIFFYGLGEGGMWLGMQGAAPQFPVPDGQLQLPVLVANRHVMFLDKKASSSGVVKPPMAREILDYYTADQLRAHFFSLGLGIRSVGFRPKPLNPAAQEKEGDPVMKEANLLSNTFNRAVRSCFYINQQYYERRLPAGEVSEDVLAQSKQAVLEFEQLMFKHEFHSTIEVLGKYLRDINQRWSRAKPYNEDCAPDLRRQTVIDCFHMVRVAATLVHPIAPTGTEMIREYLCLGEDLWSWDRIFDTLYELMPDPSRHEFKVLESRVDFFPKHSSQIREE
jgi:methionyl-tRNA synthetase